MSSQSLCCLKAEDNIPSFALAVHSPRPELVGAIVDVAPVDPRRARCEGVSVRRDPDRADRVGGKLLRGRDEDWH